MKLTKSIIREIIEEVIAEAGQKFYARDPDGDQISVFTDKDNYKDAVKGGYEKVDREDAERELAGKEKAPDKPEAKPKTTSISKSGGFGDKKEKPSGEKPSGEKTSGYDEYEEDNDGNYQYTGNDPKLKSLHKAYASVSGDGKNWSNAPISRQEYQQLGMKKFTEKQAKKISAGLDASRNDAYETAKSSDSDEDWHRYYATDKIADNWSRIMDSGTEYKQEESITSQLKREFKQYNKINKNLTRG